MKLKKIFEFIIDQFTPSWLIRQDEKDKWKRKPQTRQINKPSIKLLYLPNTYRNIKKYIYKKLITGLEQAPIRFGIIPLFILLFLPLDILMWFLGQITQTIEYNKEAEDKKMPKKGYEPFILIGCVVGFLVFAISDYKAEGKFQTSINKGLNQGSNHLLREVEQLVPWNTPTEQGPKNIINTVVTSNNQSNDVITEPTTTEIFPSNNSPDNLIVVETDEDLDIDDANIRISYN